MPGPLKRHAQAIIDAGIPFIGHLGLLPQLYYKRGGFRVYGKTAEEAMELFEEARALEEMGASAIELKAAPHEAETEIARRINIPVFGIGTGPDADGQFIVCTDVFGMQKDFSVTFAKKYINMWELCEKAMHEAIDDIRTGAFPAPENCFNMKEDELAVFRAQIK